MLRLQFDTGNAYDEDDDEKADRKRMQIKNNQRIKRPHEGARNRNSLTHDDGKVAKQASSIPTNNESAGLSDYVALQRPIDLPFYKCVQLPEHLKWINVHGVSSLTDNPYQHVTMLVLL